MVGGLAPRRREVPYVPPIMSRRTSDGPYVAEVMRLTNSGDRGEAGAGPGHRPGAVVA